MLFKVDKIDKTWWDLVELLQRYGYVIYYYIFVYNIKKQM